MNKASRWWDLPSAVLLFVATLFSAWRLQTTDWTDGLGHVRNVAIWGLLVGLALGQSQFKKRGVMFLSIGYMLVVFIWQWLGVISFEEKVNLGERLVILFARLFTDVGEFFAGRPVEDQLLVIALLCFPYWFASLFSGYQLTRYANYLASILPGGILMMFVFIYHFTAKDYTWMFGVYLFLSLLLLGRQKYLLDRKKWMKERVQVSSESALDLNNTSMVIAAALIMLAWGIPYTLTSNVDMKEAWQKTTNDWFSGSRFENLFKSVNKEKKPVPRNFQSELFLGNQAVLSELVVFLVHTPSSADEFPRLYWRGQVYDTYENERWLTSAESEIRHNQTDGDLEIPDTANRKRVSFTFDVYSEGQTIMYSAAQPIWMNHGAIILHNRLSEDDESELMDAMAFRALPMLEAGDLYRMSAMMANPTVPELQESGEEYPEWVTEKYLQLPKDFSERIRSLAQEITAEYDTPYDKTVAITNYLRAEIRYTPGISFPPGEDVDPIEYFLFDAKQGFCNYYATTEVLMLRAVGIPARLAVGYAQGEPNIQKSIYTVRERDLHAWPEVYFAGYGWIEFEPTGNQDPLERPFEREERQPVASAPSNPIPQAPLLEDLIPTVEPSEPTLVEATGPSLPRWVITLSGIILFILLVVFLKRRLAPNTPVAALLKNGIDRSGFNLPAWMMRWIIFGTLPPIERYFHSINLGLHWLGKPQPMHITAAERALILKKMLPDVAPSIEALLREHQSGLFSPHGGNEALARRAAWYIILKSLQRRLKIIILGYNYT